MQTPSEALRNFVGFAKDIFGVGEGEYELRNHDGMGFCWGSAALASFSSGFISKYRVTETPGGQSGQGRPRGRLVAPDDSPGPPKCEEQL